jgi:hypothetical protein
MVSYGIATQDNKTILKNPVSGNEWVGVWGGGRVSRLVSTACRPKRCSW